MKIINLEKHWEDVERKKKKNNLLLSLCTLAKNVPSARINLGTTVIFMLSDFFPVFSFGILFPFKFIPLSIETPTTPKNLLIFLFIEVIKNLFFSFPSLLFITRYISNYYRIFYSFVFLLLFYFHSTILISLCYFQLNFCFPIYIIKLKTSGFYSNNFSNFSNNYCCSFSIFFSFCLFFRRHLFHFSLYTICFQFCSILFFIHNLIVIYSFGGFPFLPGIAFFLSNIFSQFIFSLHGNLIRLKPVFFVITCMFSNYF